MYSVKGDGITIYNDIYVTESAKAINPKLTLKDNSAGSLEITLPPGNAGYDKLKRLSSEIAVYRDGKEIWSGRIISEKKDFRNNRILTCEGELAYLNDTTQPPREYTYEYSATSVREFLKDLIHEHNSKAGDDKQFAIGGVEVTVDEGENLYRVTDNESTLKAINNLIIDKFGGHLRIRKETDESGKTTRYLDYLKTYPGTTDAQEIRFGQNLLDFTANWDMSELVTVVMPRGVKLEQSPIESLDAYLDVSEVNGGSRYVTNEEAIKEYGWIEAVVDWEDVTDAAELLKKARTYLEEEQFSNMVIKVSAVDMRYMSKGIRSIDLLDEVRCISRPHGMNRSFPVTELTIQLDKPENSTYTLGDTISESTLTGSVKAANTDILNRIASLPTEQSTLNKAKESAISLITSATRGYVTITKNEEGSQAMVISSRPAKDAYNPVNDTWEKGTKLWMWNMGGLAYFKDGYPPGDPSKVPVAITMNGEIVADFIKTGYMSADRIKTGIIQSDNDNSKWNLRTGEFTMVNGSISLGRGVAREYSFQVTDEGEIYAELGNIGGFTIGEHPDSTHKNTMCIYNDVMNLNSYGLEFYIDGGDLLGTYGTQHWTLDEDCKGLTVSLEHNTAYIAWVYKENTSDDDYKIKMMYTSQKLPADNGEKFAPDRIHFGCDIDFNGHEMHGYVVDGKRVVDVEDTVLLPTNITDQGMIRAAARVKIKKGFVVEV